MNTDEYRRMYDVEDTHWWYNNLHHMVLNVLRRSLKGGGGRRLRILDAGCGTGAMAIKLAELGDVTAMDFSHDALRFCRDRDLSDLVAGSVNELPFADASFDVVVSLDVLCHQSVDERRAARELARVLRPGGLLVLNLPAYEWLKGQHDVAVQTARRYTRGRVRALYQGAGLQVLQVRHWNTILFPAAAAMRIASRRRLSEEGASDVQPVRPAVNETLKGVMGLERRLFNRVPLPFGLSVIAVGRRPEVAAS